jgi:hypothetical protein
MCVLKAYDVGESMYVHLFGAYFGLSVAKVLHHKEVESEKEGANYNSDLFAMIGKKNSSFFFNTVAPFSKNFLTHLRHIVSLGVLGEPSF